MDKIIPFSDFPNRKESDNSIAESDPRLIIELRNYFYGQIRRKILTKDPEVISTPVCEFGDYIQGLLFTYAKENVRMITNNFDEQGGFDIVKPHIADLLEDKSYTGKIRIISYGDETEVKESESNLESLLREFPFSKKLEFKSGYAEGFPFPLFYSVDDNRVTQFEFSESDFRYYQRTCLDDTYRELSEVPKEHSIYEFNQEFDRIWNGL